MRIHKYNSLQLGNAAVLSKSTAWAKSSPKAVICLFVKINVIFFPVSTVPVKLTSVWQYVLCIIDTVT